MQFFVAKHSTHREMIPGAWVSFEIPVPYLFEHHLENSIATLLRYAIFSSGDVISTTPININDIFGGFGGFGGSTGNNIY